MITNQLFLKPLHLKAYNTTKENTALIFIILFYFIISESKPNHVFET